MLRPIVAFTFITFPIIYANAQVVGGTISGFVLDSGGAAISGASVTVRNQETGGERHLISDSAGAYAAPSIPIGVYTASVIDDGFAPQIRAGVSLTVG